MTLTFNLKTGFKVTVYSLPKDTLWVKNEIGPREGNICPGQAVLDGQTGKDGQMDRLITIGCTQSETLLKTLNNCPFNVHLHTYQVSVY